MYRTCDLVSGETCSRSSHWKYAYPNVFFGSDLRCSTESVLEVKRGRSRSIRRPVGDRSMASRSRVMKNGWAVVSPNKAIKSGGCERSQSWF